MPGIAANFKILELCSQRLELEAVAHPELAPVAAALHEHAPYAYLGALGPALADFMPPDAQQNPYARLWRRVFGFIGDNLANPEGPGLYSVLSLIRRTLDRAIDAARDEDLGALGDVGKDEERVKKAMEDVNELVELLLDPDFLSEMGTAILQDLTPSLTPSLRPFVEAAQAEGFVELPPLEQLARLSDILSSDYHTIPGPGEWTVRELLSWKRTGRFARTLRTSAQAPEQQAYAYGYTIAYIAGVVGSPFINSIVGSPFRLDWWRTRWIQLFVDTWVHGFYGAGASMNGDTASPPYDTWPDLAEAQLQARIEVDENAGFDPQDLMRRLWEGEPFESVLPVSFTEYWRAAFGQVYPDLPQATAITDQVLNGAYQLTWLVLWFQTSGEVLHFVPQAVEVIDEDEDCGEAPPWVNPPDADNEETGETEEQEVPPEVEGKPDKGKMICGIIMAILGGLLFVAGGLVTGGIGLGVGAWLAEENAPDWHKLRCGLFWRKQRMNLTVLKFHDLLVIAGLAHPYSRHLTVEQDVEMPAPEGDEPVMGDIVTYHSALKTTKSGVTTGFPKRALATNLLFGVIPLLQLYQQVQLGEAEAAEMTLWTEPQDPEAPVEEPATMAYGVPAYPDFFIDSSLNVLLPPGVLAQVDLEDAGAPPPAPTGSGFGNAVDNAVYVFLHLDEDFPDWNLDGDRGMFFPTWQFATETYPNTQPVVITAEA